MMDFQREVISSSACVPGDRRELALALRADAAQRRRQAFGRMHQFGVAVDLGAGEAGGERLVGIALDAHHASVLDMRQQRAHVGTIVRTDHADGFHASSPRQQAIDGTPERSRCDRPCCHRRARPLRATKGLSLRVPTGRQWQLAVDETEAVTPRIRGTVVIPAQAGTQPLLVTQLRPGFPLARE